ncbi:hypothetical protein LSCM1_02772 [Leishmania martiniquensis]|uniref:LIM zinc-binding domain-containing protein n=1 Tax=Leishmania martiniquensis TaxID=1580590 RepID=A0A836KAR1_9TRYP|nr:hypothetical protein LSCM1_02772 [Leishmania martiniquensis]
METNSADNTSDSSLGGAIFPPAGNEIDSVPQEVDAPTGTTGDGQEHRTDVLIAAQDDANGSAAEQKAEGDGVSDATTAVASTGLPAKLPLSKKGSKKAEGEVNSPVAVPVSDEVGYSSAITLGASSTSEPKKLYPSPSPRSLYTGRQVIADAYKLTDPVSPGPGGNYSAVYTAGGLSVNGQYKTIAEEHAEFRQRNKVGVNYHGPVYVVEDVCVPCNACGGPVDPVRRVPVGSLFFHEGCLHCFLCERRTGAAGLYLQADRRAVCSDCAGRGYEHWVPRKEAQSRGMVYGAIRGEVHAALDAHDRDAEQRRLRRRRNSEQKRLIAGLPSKAGGAFSTLNKATIPGALPPSLAISNVHNCRNTSVRSFALMERQQYYTQSDNNVIMALPTSAARSPCVSGSQQGRAAKAQRSITHVRGA